MKIKRLMILLGVLLTMFVFPKIEAMAAITATSYPYEWVHTERQSYLISSAYTTSYQEQTGTQKVCTTTATPVSHATYYATFYPWQWNNGHPIDAHYGPPGHYGAPYWTTYNYSTTCQDEPVYTTYYVNHPAVYGTRNVTVTTDVYPPTMTIIPSTTNITNGNVTLNLTTSGDASGVTQIEMPDGTTVNGTSASYTAQSNGTYTFTVFDNAGLEFTQSYTVSNIDKLPPAAPTMTLSGVENQWVNQNITVTLTNNGDQGVSGVNRIEYSLSGAINQGWATYGSPVVISANGVTTISARVVDNAGNVSSTVSKTVKIDTVAPVLNVTANTTDMTNAETLTATASDNASGLQAIMLPDGNWVTGMDTVTYQVGKNGSYSFTAKDNVGNLRTITYDVTNVKQNVLITNTPDVLLKLHAEDVLSGVKSMQFRNEYGSWSAWQPYTTEVNWTLENGDGLKHVWARYMDNAGNVSNPVEDIIILDTTPPTISSFTINGGAQYTNNPNVTLKMSANDALTGVKDIYLSNDGTNWTEMPYATSVPWTLSNGDGNKTVYLKVSDVAGNISSPTTSSIFLDTTKPNVSVKINGGAQYTATRDVTLTINYSDPSPGSGVSEIKVFEGSKEYDIPQPLPNSPITIPWTLDYGTVRTVSVEAIDRAGNVSDMASATILVDKLTLQDFILENVVNPLAFTEAKPFTPLTWSFAPQPMLAGANFTFAIDIKPSSDPSAVTDSVTYEADVVGDNGYHKVFTGTMTKAVNHYTQTITLPADAPKGAKVYVSAVATRKLLVAPYDTQTVYFPGTDASSQAEIGTIQGNIYNSILFNETT